MIDHSKSSITARLAKRLASDRLEPSASKAPRNGVGKLHVVHPIGKCGERHLAFTADGCNEIFLDLPLSALLSRDGNFGELPIPFAAAKQPVAGQP